jgi:superfamily II DNA or RNA helicase
VGGSVTPEPFRYSYADNNVVTMAARLRAEISDRRARRLDIATGFLAVTAWAAVGPELERLDGLRLLLGKDYELVRATRAQDEADIGSLVAQALREDSEPPRLPELADAELVRSYLAFLERETTQVRAWRGDGFLHAKAYILDGSAGVGSANFTGNGLEHNRELVMWRQDDAVVRELRDWFEGYWNDRSSVDYKQELVDALRGTRFGGKEYTPYQVLVRVLAERYGLDAPPSLQEATFRLKWFQTDAVYRLIKLLSGPARGALLADAVGMGKTFMALGVIHHFLYQQRQTVQGKPVTLIVPASLRQTWERELDRYNLRWAVEMLHTQNLRAGFDVGPFTGADLVVIDEAHRLRGRGMWFEKVMELLDRSSADPRVLLLTAIPVNTGIDDLTTLLRVLTKNRRNVWAPEIPDFDRYLKRVERNEVDPYPVLDRSMVRRSRSDILAAYEERRQAGQFVEPVKLPERRLAHQDYAYSTDEAAGRMVFGAFARVVPSLRLAPYDLERFRRSPDGSPLDQASVPTSSLAGLYLSGLLKRFESSLRAIRISLRRLDRVLELFGRALADEPPRVLSLERQPELRHLVRAETDEDDDETGDLDPRWDELLAVLPSLPDAELYDLEAVADAIEADRAGVAELLAVLPPEDGDGKVAALLELLQRPVRSTRVGLVGKRVLVFTQFRDTAVYLGERLAHAALGGLAVIHGGTDSGRRASVARTFDPDAVGELEAAATGVEPPRVLVSTDVLAEGHNLQLAEAVVNFDLHWNPQVAVQRSGRVDRLNSPHRAVYLVSFLPEEGLEQHLGLARRLNERFALYKLLGLADEPVTRLSADQVTGVSFEQLRRLYQDEASVLDDIEKTFTLGSTDYMRQPLEIFLANQAREALEGIPIGVQSVKRLPRAWGQGPGVFVALAHGADDAKETFWRFYPRTPSGWGPPVIDDVEVFRAIVCSTTEPRAFIIEEGAPTGAGGIIDWDLLRRSAKEVADALTLRRSTAAVTRGASEGSSRVRAQLLSLCADLEVEELDPLLDRLEQVRVEDYDARPGYRPFRDRLRHAQRSDSPAERRDLLLELAARGKEMFGDPEPDDEIEPTEVQPGEMRLVAWEVLLEGDVQRPSAATQETLPEG